MNRSKAHPDPLTRDHEGERPDILAAVRRQARQRIDDDRQRYPEDLGPVFEILAARLFEPGFYAKAAVPDQTARRRFRLAVGLTPRAYRDRQLLEAALELVRETTLTVRDIAAGLGFDDPELFTKWFRRRTGEAPTTLRPTAGGPPDQISTPPDAETVEDEPWTDRECRKAAAWAVGPRRGATLIRIIRELYPALDRPTTR